MIQRTVCYLRRHHVAVLAIFLALGGTGAYAASRSASAQIRGFAASPTANSSGTLAHLGSVSLRWKSVNRPDERDCWLYLHAARAGDVAVFSGDRRTGAPAQAVVVSRRLDSAGSAVVAHAQFLPGAPNVAEHIEGQLTYGDEPHTNVETAIFHVAAQKFRCLFEGTLTGSG